MIFAYAHAAPTAAFTLIIGIPLAAACITGTTPREQRAMVAHQRARRSGRRIVRRVRGGAVS